jgi:hypothetical protein
MALLPGYPFYFYRRRRILSQICRIKSLHRICISPFNTATGISYSRLNVHVTDAHYECPCDYYPSHKLTL